ncbi:MAG: bifunctional phosphoribosylaminoimidazolecarboxamide formyltransferase/IMP cyclohydrolase [Actinobacteria bacterium]|nr:bifunctional phosphoribosylaminoimidazolecarboxamide formyltransferase/IMP cyclohydrolase [Actinomycetota bacterium]
MSQFVVRRALVSVYDKSGLIEFGKRLVGAGVELVSSGGTAAFLEDGGLPVTRVADVTGAPEMLDGRVKTLHPVIHGGILARMDHEPDRRDLAEREIEPFQLVVVNLYPFRETVADPDATDADIAEQIDIGGPAMIRSAAKNHRHVGVVTSPSQYEFVASAIEEGAFDIEKRTALAAEAFFQTASYDAAIVGWIGDDVVIPLRHAADLRYGENPHQDAAILVEDGASPWWAAATQHQGKEMSFNNYADAEAAWRLACDLEASAVVVLKHTNPCGVGVATSVSEAFEKAWSGDSLAAFGGVVAINGTLDSGTASAIADRFVEVVVALDVHPDALRILEAKKNLRVLSAPAPSARGRDYRRVDGGLLAQARDEVDMTSWEVVSERQPTAAELSEMRFAWTIAAHAKSNAIVITVDGHAVAVGAGDQSRVGAAERAVAKAAGRATGATAASDAFFPFRDGLDTLIAAGVTAIVEPGGSIRDQEVIDAANEQGVALVFTGMRHFRH